MAQQCMRKRKGRRSIRGVPAASLCPHLVSAANGHGLRAHSHVVKAVEARARAAATAFPIVVGAGRRACVESLAHPLTVKGAPLPRQPRESPLGSANLGVLRRSLKTFVTRALAALGLPRHHAAVAAGRWGQGGGSVRHPAAIVALQTRPLTANGAACPAEWDQQTRTWARRSLCLPYAP